MKNSKKGLTLIELLAVIAIIAILFVLLIPQISSGIKKARESGIMVDFRDYERGVKAYFIEKGTNEYATVTTLNPFLEKELKFKTDLTSTKKSPIDEKYKLKVLGRSLISVKVEKEGQKYTLFVSSYHGEIRSFASGLDAVEGMDKIIEDENFEYVKLNDESVSLVGYKKTGGSIVIPNEINGMKVVEIAEKTFEKRGITSVKLPDYLIMIGGSSFRENELTQVEIPANVEIISGTVFEKNKITTVTFLTNKLTLIAWGAFLENEITTVTIPASVKEIKSQAFNGNLMTTYRILGNPTIDPTSFPEKAVRQ